MSARAEIEPMLKTFQDAMKKGDFHAVGLLYAQDAKLMPPNAPVVEGRSEIEAFYKTFPISIDVDVKTILKSVTESGDLVVAHIAWDVISTGTKLDAGKALTVYRRQGGKLEIIYDMWNSVAPAAK